MIDFENFIESCPLEVPKQFMVNKYYYKPPHLYVRVYDYRYNKFINTWHFMAEQIDARYNVDKSKLLGYAVDAIPLGLYDNATDGWYEIEHTIWEKLKKKVYG